MKSDLERTTSLWMATASTPSGAPLKGDLRAQVCVVGAGIAGMTTAYLPRKTGKTVAVLDDGAIGGGQTARTTAHLSNAVDDRYFEIERLHGARGARLAAESHTEAIARIEAIVETEHIDCDFVRLDGYLFAPPGASPEILTRELGAARRAGLGTFELQGSSALPFFDTGPCLRFPGQAQLHPLKYLNGLARAFLQDGGQVFTGTHMTAVHPGSPLRVETEGGAAVLADAVVIATNTPINERIGVHLKQAPYRSYVIAGPVPSGSVPRALYWDTADPYHYVRLSPGQKRDMLVVGGEDHKTGRSQDGFMPYGRLESWARERFPMLGKLEFRWSGQVLEPVDGVAFIGRNPTDEPGVTIATGDSGMGMTHGTIAGILLTALLNGQEHPWSDLYRPDRLTPRAAPEYAKETAQVAASYADWLRGGDVGEAEEIAPGSGAVIRHGLHKVAVHRDEDGTLHALSAVCTHLGCIVVWNPEEHTWDCPCHGSRFDARGRVINGPAVEDLPPAAERGEKKKAG